MRTVGEIKESWAMHKLAQRDLCVCGHAEWQHDGFDPGCTHLGSCRCPRYDPT